MKKIAVIGANSFQNPLILKAKQLGYETHVFAWKCGDVGEKTADFFYPISIVEKEQILETCRKIGIDAIVSIASDLATVTVNYVAEKMKLHGNSIACTSQATNKYLMRQTFLTHGVPTPKFTVVTSQQLTQLQSDATGEMLDKLVLGMEYPLIVKPTDRSGSRSINKITSREQICPAIAQAIEDSFEDKAIVEEYIEGEEFSMEGITFEGQHHFICTTRKATTGAPHFIETGHIQPAGLTHQMEDKIQSMLSKALDALEVTNSATHSEFKITPDGEVRIIEIGARMGGDCIGSDLVQISTGYDFIKMVIDVALGQAPVFEKVCEPKIAVIRFIMNEMDMEKFKRVQKEVPDMVYYVSELEKTASHEVKDSSTRYGYYILACDDKEKIRWLLNEREQY